VPVQELAKQTYHLDRQGHPSARHQTDSTVQAMAAILVIHPHQKYCWRINLLIVVYFDFQAGLGLRVIGVNFLQIISLSILTMVWDL